MAKNKLDAVSFCRIFDLFGEQAAKDTSKDVNDGKIRVETIEKYIYQDMTKEEYAEVLKKQ